MVSMSKTAIDDKKEYKIRRQIINLVNNWGVQDGYIRSNPIPKSGEFSLHVKEAFIIMPMLTFEHKVSRKKGIGSLVRVQKRA